MIPGTEWVARGQDMVLLRGDAELACVRRTKGGTYRYAWAVSGASGCAETELRARRAAETFLHQTRWAQ